MRSHPGISFKSVLKAFNFSTTVVAGARHGGTCL